MPDTIKINEELNIIEVFSVGSISSDEIAGSFKIVQNILKESRINKILVDTRKQITLPPTSNIFELFSSFPSDFKVAMLIDKDQITFKDVQFIETTAQNRSINIKTFEQKDSAVVWLQK